MSFIKTHSHCKPSTLFEYSVLEKCPSFVVMCHHFYVTPVDEFTFEMRSCDSWTFL